MKILENKNKLNNLLSALKKKDVQLGLIPTMGSIHKGHLSLVKESKKNKCFSLVTIFINPTQFNDLNDYKNYPRNKKEDIKKLIESKCDALYFPKIEDLYPKKIKSIKTVYDYREILCDKFRPGHFDGVTTVVKSLFKLIKPEFAFFGEKDFQQLKIINKLNQKYNFSINIKSCPSMRLKNGMSFSSRYSNFNNNQKIIFDQVAKKLKKYVRILKYKIDLSYLDILKKELKKNNIKKIEYLEIRKEKDLNLTKTKNKARLFVSFYIDNIRIIDNFILY